MSEHFCHICGTKFEGSFCPGCGAALTSPEEPLRADLPAASGPPSRRRSRPKGPAAPPLSGLPSYIRKVRNFLWIMLASMLVLSVLFVLRNPTYGEDIFQNLDQFAQIRKNIVYFWESPEASARFAAPVTFFGNILHFLKLAGDNIFNALEEVSAIWT